MKKRILIGLAIVALNIAVVGVTVAITVPTSAKACANSSGALKLMVNGSCGTNIPITLPTKNYPGLPKAYAHINTGGALDAAHSWNVAASNLYTTGNGLYCFRNLSFNPKNADVSLDYFGPGNGDIPVVSLSLTPSVSTDCGLATLPQLFVFIGLVDPGVVTTGEDFGFYITIY